MKRLLGYLSALTFVLFTGCEHSSFIFEPDYTPPVVPVGVQVLNGNGFTEISWRANRESDLSGYNVYVSNRYDGKYTLIGTTHSTYFTDDVVRNGMTYYYAVTAFDVNNNESDLSYECAYGIPRPDGFNKSILDYTRFPSNSGFDFSENAITAYDALAADVFFGRVSGDLVLKVWDDTDIQDMGATSDIYDISYAPAVGWSNTKSERVIAGHTYVIWTYNNHYAKLRVTKITNDRITFDWAYQLIEGEPTLRPGKQIMKDADRELRTAESQ